MKRKWLRTKDFGNTWEEIVPEPGAPLLVSGNRLIEGEILWSGDIGWGYKWEEPE